MLKDRARFRNGKPPAANSPVGKLRPQPARRTMSAVTLESVTKTFGAHTAVSDLSLDVPAGSIYGFIGPNGSGKTTTLRMIMRILLPDRGTIRVLGQEHPATSGPASVLDRVAYLPEERGLYK